MNKANIRAQNNLLEMLAKEDSFEKSKTIKRTRRFTKRINNKKLKKRFSKINSKIKSDMNSQMNSLFTKTSNIPNFKD